MRRLARLGAGPFLAAASTDFEDDGSETTTFFGTFARPSSRFLSVTESREPLKTCACSFVTASCAAAGVENSTWAGVIISSV